MRFWLSVKFQCIGRRLLATKIPIIPHTAHQPAQAIPARGDRVPIWTKITESTSQTFRHRRGSTVASPALSAGLWSLRVARGTVEDFLEVVNRLGKRWGRTLLLDPGFELLLTYMLQGSGLTPDELEEKVSKAIEDSLIEEAVVTTYDQLIEKGRKEGRQQGLQEGLQKGRDEERHERAVVFAGKLLDKGMSVDEVAELTELPLEEVRKIAEKRSEK